MSESNCYLTVDTLLSENKELSNKIKVLLQELSNHNLYTIDLEKRVIDLEFQLHQTNLFRPLHLNYEEKYKKMVQIFDQVKEHYSFSIDNSFVIKEESSFSKLISLIEKIEQERENTFLEKLKEDLSKKENLISQMNILLFKKEENFTMKTEQMKSQINYLIGLLNVKSEEEKNKKLLEVIKIITQKNNELIGKDENAFLKEEIKRKNEVIEVLTRNINELEAIKLKNEEIKLINENIFSACREAEFNLKKKSLESEIKEANLASLNEKINFLKMENDSLFFKNRSLQKIGEDFYEKERILEKKETDLIKKEINLEGKERHFKENKGSLKKKKFKIKKLKKIKNEKKEEIYKINEENEKLKKEIWNLENEKEEIKKEFNYKLEENISNLRIQIEKLFSENNSLKEIIKEKEIIINDLIMKSNDSTLEVLGKEKYILRDENTKLYKKIDEMKEKMQFYLQKCNDLMVESKNLKDEKEQNENQKKEVEELRQEVQELKKELDDKNKLQVELEEIRKKTGQSDLLQEISEKDIMIQRLNSTLDKLKEAFIKLKESKKGS